MVVVGWRFCGLIIDPPSSHIVDNILKNHKPEFNNTEFRKLLLKEGFGEVNFTDMYAAFKRIVREGKDST